MIFVETERLCLRQARAEDFAPLLQSWGDPAMTRYMEEKPDLPAFLRDLIADMQVRAPGSDGWYQYMVERRSDGALVGDLGAGFGVPGPRQVELGYRVLPDFHRMGYAKEALAGLLTHLIEAHDVHRFVAVAASANMASCATLRALGFRGEGRFRQSFLCRGEWIDDDYYALLASEWKGQAARA